MANMHRAEYYLVANALAKCKSLGQDNLEYVADMLAVDFLKEDPTFKRELFMEVSGVEKTDNSFKPPYGFGGNGGYANTSSTPEPGE